jgi:hypothetical protein
MTFGKLAFWRLKKRLISAVRITKPITLVEVAKKIHMSYSLCHFLVPHLFQRRYIS